jgi:hypothetical protein
VRTYGHVSHNTFLQFSSETGIPGLLMFLAMLYFGSRSVWLRRNRFVSRAPERIRDVAVHLRLCFVSTLVCLFFLSMNYGDLLFLLCGLGAALERTIEQEVAGAIIPRPPVAAEPLEKWQPAAPLASRPARTGFHR